MKKSLFLLFLLLCFSNCSKNEFTHIKSDPGNVSAAKLKSEGVVNVIGSPSEDTYVRAFNTYTGENVLQRLIAENDEVQLNGFLNYTADRIKNNTLRKYNIDLSGDDRDLIILFGMLEGAKEKFITNGQVVPEGDATFSCFMSAVSGFLGLTTAKSLWTSITSGASEETVVAALRLIGGRIGTVVGVAIMVYQVGDCMDWWYEEPMVIGGNTGGAPDPVDMPDPGTPINPGDNPDPNPDPDQPVPADVTIHYNYIPYMFYSSQAFFDEVKPKIVDYLVNIRGMGPVYAAMIIDDIYTRQLRSITYPRNEIPVVGAFGYVVDEYFRYVYGK